MGKVFKIIREYVGVLFGVAITAFGLSWFLIPSRIAAGGVSGLATVAYHLFDFPVGLTMLPLISVVYRWHYNSWGGLWCENVYWYHNTVTVSGFVSALGCAFDLDPLLSAIYGGVVTGIGLGITFRFGGSTGGTDMAAQLIAKFFPLLLVEHCC